MESKPRTKTLQELLNETEESEDECTCHHCGYTQDSAFQKCPECKTWIEYPTLGEWGKQMPIGIEQDDNTFLRSFELEPIDWPKEREINKHWATQAKRSNIALSEYIGTILACTVTHVGNQDITGFKFNKRLLIFNQMYQADVFYIYAYLRLISLGKELPMGDIRCLNCGHQFPYTADLTTLETVVINKPSDLVTEITLEKGFEMNNDVKTKIKVKPPLWNMMDSSFPLSRNDAETFLAMVMNCVVEIEGMPDGSILTEREVSQFGKIDIEICQDAMEDVLAGPRWEIEGICPKCDSMFYDLIDWSYDRFFARSSRSRRRRRRSRRSSR